MYSMKVSDGFDDVSCSLAYAWMFYERLSKYWTYSFSFLKMDWVPVCVIWNNSIFVSNERVLGFICCVGIYSHWVPFSVKTLYEKDKIYQVPMVTEYHSSLINTIHSTPVWPCVHEHIYHHVYWYENIVFE